MVYLDDLPTDSVLRRHARTERNRALGLPPSDAVLRRHYQQLLAAQAAVAAIAAAPARRLVPARAAVAQAAETRTNTPAAVRVEAPSAAAPNPSGGGLFGWFRRLLGA